MNIIGLSGSLSAPSRTRALVAAVIGEISRQTGHGGPVIDIADIAADLGRTLGTFGKRRPNPVLTPQTLSLSRRSFTADKSKCPGSKSSPHHSRMAWCSGWSGSRMASRKSA